ncbi:DUF6504 family protein [Actinomadura kijaniata]|uniref:DUF6504 family protein n=1 Tax=Actinomadura kijaniata TaxID=46161 RepID=UPI000837483B|nr:DUF6504 family protein [Actinomadura kijaniata]
MTRVFGDPIEVATAADGRPRGFVWRGHEYTVRRVLEHWVTTRDWWHERDLADMEPGEREYWRVEASPGRETGVYELRHDAVTGVWTLARMWD